MAHARAPKGLRPNRSDLTKPTAATVPGQGYGDAAQQRVAQQAIPMGPPVAAPGASLSPSPPAPVPAPVPASQGPISRPSERPNEPVTHGLPVGPGAGPEALDGVGAAARQSALEQGTLTHLLTSLAAQPNATSAIRDLAARVQGTL